MKKKKDRGGGEPSENPRGGKKRASGDPKLRISNSPRRMHVLLKVRRRAVRSGRRAPQAAPGLESLRSRSEGREAPEEAARPPACPPARASLSPPAPGRKAGFLGSAAVRRSASPELGEALPPRRRDPRRPRRRRRAYEEEAATAAVAVAAAHKGAAVG